MSDKKKMKDSSKSSKRFLDLFYMTPSIVEAKEIADLLKGNTDLVVELWPEMNVLELELPNKNTVDFELLSVDFKDPSNLAFVKNRKIRTIFGINLVEEDLGKVKGLFEQVIEQFSGFLCTDSPDFQPVLIGSADNPTK